jgi:hypothetical protein
VCHCVCDTPAQYLREEPEGIKPPPPTLQIRDACCKRLIGCVSITNEVMFYYTLKQSQSVCHSMRYVHMYASEPGDAHSTRYEFVESMTYSEVIVD